MLKKGWNTRLSYDTLKEELEDINPAERSFKIMLDKARHNAKICMQDYFKYTKERWDKSHRPPDFKVGGFVLISTLKFNEMKGPNKLKNFFEGTFIIKELHGHHAVELEFTG
ncbi:hypothetical protein O181_044621 [Austropuccinia psidii MF-1]|uniref:Uncharacterized protein n=1 Tax=Austropuccinia psidii MF-1 TaxID=1389203 RepID=A0A9Q3DQR6_9BASI|nr:hypothetical protein [Austropuccinia psidii MF-1]